MQSELFLPDREGAAGLLAAIDSVRLDAGGEVYKELRVGLSGVMYCSSAGVASSPKESFLVKLLYHRSAHGWIL